MSSIPQNKIGPKCNTDKQLFDFNKTRRNKDGYQYHCRDCQSKEWKRYYQNSHICGKQGEQYHHHKGYAPEHRLDVVPICRKCHDELENPFIINR